MVNKNAVFYVCSLIEYIGRETKNHRSYVVQKMGEDGVRHHLEFADINHCLPFAQVCAEVVEKYGIKNGTFDTISHCKYSIPFFIDIGSVYRDLVVEQAAEMPVEKAVIAVFSSFISDAISNFNSDMYYQSPQYLLACYKAGEILY